MKAAVAIGLILIVAAGAGVYFLYNSGYIIIKGLNTLDGSGGEQGAVTPPPETNPVELGLSERDVFFALESLAGKQLDYSIFSPYYSALHMKMWGVNDQTALSVLQKYEADYAADGWTSQGRAPKYSSNWVAYMEGWIKGTNARLIIVGEGAAVNQAYGYDMLILTSWGSATTYVQFYNALK